MKKFLSMLAIAALVTSFWACDEDEDGTPDGPSVSTENNVVNVQVSTSHDVTFDVTTPGGYKSVAVTAVGGTATKKSEPAAGTESGEVVVTFAADANAGAGNVMITVTDNNDKTGSATATINKTVEPVEETVIEVTANISEDATWETGKIYILTQRIAVLEGATLTIEPGVIVKGEAGSSANASALIIARGAKIMAEGTAEQPIIFTAISDEIEPGMVESPNLDIEVNGQWGGLIVLGRAPISVSTNEQNWQIEGIPPSDTNGAYGGNDPEDNSGVIRYVSIRHGGANIGEGNEINGLTLGGVGSGTTIENVEVVSNFDDGIEFFGGSVNVTNAIVWGAGDDAIDTDQAWTGTLDNFIVIGAEDTGDHGIEADGPEGTLNGAHTVTNGTIKGSSTMELADFRSGARGTFSNIYFFNFEDPAVDGDGDLSLSNDEGTTTTTDNFANGILVFDALETTLPEGVQLNAVFKAGTSAHATNVAAGENTVGADASVFGWTYASALEQLAGF